MENKNSRTSQIAGLLMAGCMFVGIGIGMYYENTGVGTMVGMGAGLLGMGVVYLLKKD